MRTRRQFLKTLLSVTGIALVSFASPTLAVNLFKSKGSKLEVKAGTGIATDQSNLSLEIDGSCLIEKNGTMQWESPNEAVTKQYVDGVELETGDRLFFDLSTEGAKSNGVYLVEECKW